MKFEFENVFITGSNGWLGKQLVLSLLNDDNEVLIFKKPMNIKINCLINIPILKPNEIEQSGSRQNKYNL